MKIKKLNLFITSNDVNDFGKSFTIKKSYIYLLILFSLCILFFFAVGIYSFFLSADIDIDSKNIVNVDSNTKNSSNNLSLFSNDPVKIKNKSDFIAPTSYITTSFTEEHVGIDINGNIGTKIYTPMSGKVIYEGFNKKLGNIIIISHDNGYITKYMHNKKNFVNVGQKVSVNEPIAEMGNSGSSVKSEGIHLHFELWQNGVAINPTPFIKKLQTIDSNTLVLKSNVGAKNEIR